jgi:hypothetical protein
MALTDSLTAYWNMIGDSNDQNGGTYNGTDNTVTYNATFGSDTNIANYTGSSPSKTTTGASFATGASAKSLSFWFYSDSATDRGWIIAGGSDVDSQAFGVFIQSDVLIFHGNGGAYDYTILNPVTQSSWTHVVITYDGSTLQPYINGSAITSASRSLNTSSGVIWFGGRKNGDADGWFDGAISRIGVWTRAITSGEVTSLYNSGSGLTYAQLSGSTTNSGFFFLM